MKIMITGHRPNKLGGYQDSPQQQKVRQWIREQLSSRLDQNPVLISGMALGVDQWFVQEGLKLGLPFLAYIPFRGQHLNWPAPSQRQYEHLMYQAQEIVICSPDGYVLSRTPERPSQRQYEHLMYQAQEIVICSPDGYSAYKMQVRNERMVQDADVHLAVWDGTSGGTSNCVNYMIRFGATPVRLHAENL